MNLLRHLPDVGAQQRLHHRQHARVAPDALEQRAHPGHPVRLQHITLTGEGLRQDLVEQVLMAPGGVVLQALAGCFRIAGSKGLRLKTSRSMGSKCDSGWVGVAGSNAAWS